MFGWEGERKIEAETMGFLTAMRFQALITVMAKIKLASPP